jgi:POLQ-like helicase
LINQNSNFYIKIVLKWQVSITLTIGRAGRAGFNEEGESYLLLIKKEEERGFQMINKEINNVESMMNDESIQRIILEAISSNLINNLVELKNLYDLTYHSFQLKKKNIDQNTILDQFYQNLNILKESTLISEKNQNNEITFENTPYGEATYKSSFSVKDAKFVSDEFNKAQKNGIILINELHLCYLIIPLDGLSPIKWDILHKKIMKMDEINEKVLENIKLDYKLVEYRSINRGRSYSTIITESEERNVLISQRLYHALILFDIINEKSISEVSSIYDISKGDVQKFLLGCSYFSSMMVNFCKKMEWSFLQSILIQFVKRLDFGAKDDILELCEIKYIKAKTARILFNSGNIYFNK